MILEELATRLAWVLIHSLWQGALVGIVAFILLKFIRGAAARHVLGIGAMVLILTMAIFQFGKQGRKMTESTEVVSTSKTAPPLVVADLPAPIPMATVSEEVANASPIQIPPVVLPSPSPSPSPEQAPLVTESKPSFSFLPWLSALWLTGVVVLIIRHLGGWWLLQRWRSVGILPISSALKDRATQIANRLQLSRAVPLFLSDRVAMPLLIGVIKPVILLPASLVSGIRPAELDALIAHELAHLKRRDSWANHLQILIEILLFFHPAIWILGRATRRERENAADDLALESGLDQKTYAVALASVAELSAQNGRLALAANDGPVLSRIRRILLPGKTRSLSPAAGWLGTLALTLTAAFFFLSSPETSAEEKAKEASSEIIEVKEGESIRAAIKRAKPHATIRIGEGIFPEGLVIDKPLTVIGAGWDKTILKPICTNEHASSMTSVVEKTDDVQIKNLQMTIANFEKSNSRRHVLLSIRAAKVTLENCALIGPATDGVFLYEQSTAIVKNSLVAGLWGTGIKVEGDPEGKKNSRLILNKSVVRSCYHRGIVLGPECNNSKITRSHISGSAWHGIRYDSASPHIEENFIGGNARSGIYASGRTKATVKNNAFVENEMDGMSCWFGNEDSIEGNRFINNQREGISVIDTSKPVLKANLFFQKNGPAIRCSRTKKSGTDGEPILVGNVVDRGVIPMQNSQGKIAEVEGIRISEGSLKSELGDNFKHPPEPWSELLSQEKQLVPDAKTRDWRQWKTVENKSRKQAAKTVEIRNNAQEWIADAFQLDDVAKRDQAIRKMLAAIKSDEASTQLVGLTAFTSCGEVRFEKKPFHDPAVLLLGSPDPEIRALAATALLQSGMQEGDLERLLKLTRDKDSKARLAGARTLIWALEGDLTKEPYAKRIAELLDDEAIRKEILRSLWGVKISPVIEAAVLKISNTTKVSEANTNDSAYDALYYALSTQPKKSEAVVKRLIEYLAARDTHNIAGRAAWGLGYGVAQPQQDLVVKGALKLMAARQSSSYAFRQCLARVKQYATKNHLPEIRDLLKKPGVEGDLKKDLKALVDRLEG